MPGVDAQRSFPSEAGQPMPRAELVFDEADLGMTRDAILERLTERRPGGSRWRPPVPTVIYQPANA